MLNSADKSDKKLFNTLSLYESDFYLWLETTANLLKQGDFSQIDLPNLIEEIETMGRSEKRAIKNNLIVVLIHLLKYKYQPHKSSASWKASIREHRRRIKDDLMSSPSLKVYLAEIFDRCYQEARKQAADETELSLEVFPEECPFARDETLNDNYLPTV